MANKHSSNLMGKAKGTAAKAASFLAGDPGLFGKLKQEHAEVAVLMDRILATKGKLNVSTERLSLFEHFRRELLAHAHGEEKQFYPRLLRYPETQTLAKESFADHKEIEDLIDELTRMEETDPLWMDSFHNLRTSVTDHVHEEETVLFPMVADLIDADELKALEREYSLQRKAEMAAFS